MRLKYFIQFLLRQDYRVTHLYHFLRLWKEDLGKKGKIVVYQMGKVGSTTIWRSLESSSLDVPVYHIHNLSPGVIDRRVEYGKVNFSKRRFIYHEFIQSEYLRRELDRGQIDRSWYVVTLARDPIAQMISSFFQKLTEIPLGLDYREEIKRAGKDNTLNKLIERFHTSYVYNRDWEHPFEWFDHELRDNLGVDISMGPVLSNKGYHIYNGATTTKVLLLKLELLDDCHRNAFQEFLGLRNFKLVDSNVGSQKLYKDIYKEFIKRIDLPTDYINKVYSHKLVKHLYSDSDLEKFYRRWKR